MGGNSGLGGNLPPLHTLNCTLENPPAARRDRVLGGDGDHRGTSCYTIP